MSNFSRKKMDRYIGDAVLGGTDGIITTFAVVAGVEGASLAANVVIVLGTANLVADGFSMGAGNYLGVLSSHYYKESEYNRISQEVENKPDEMRESLRDIYIELGFSGDTLESVVGKISSSHDNWVRALLHEERLSEDGRSPISAGAATFISFLAFGFVPLLFYFAYYLFPEFGQDMAFPATLALSGAALLLLGVLRAWVTKGSLINGALQIFAVGGVAAILAYSVGYLLRGLL